MSGPSTAPTALFEVGIPSRDPTRAPVALALGMVALRNTPLMLATSNSTRPADAIALVAEGFDMLEEDLDKERFFARSGGPTGRPPRDRRRATLMQTLIGKLDF